VAQTEFRQGDDRLGREGAAFEYEVLETAK
jgi:hypothetical protein